MKKKKEEPDNIKKAWEEWMKIRDSKDLNNNIYIENRNILISYYYNIVESIGKRMVNKLREVTQEELISYGIDGLIYALHKYDSGRNIKFSTYASYRISGSIYDHIRNNDWVPCQIRARISRFNKKMKEIENIFGSNLDNQQIAEKLNLSEEQYIEYKNKCTPKSMTSIGRMTFSNINKDDNYISYYDDQIDNMNYDNLSYKEDKLILNLKSKEIFNKICEDILEEKEKIVIYCYYYDNIDFKNISKELKIDIKEINNIHNIAIEKIKTKLVDNEELYLDLL